jgi:hypothetical protein
MLYRLISLYVYPTDPINNDDLSGDASQRGPQGGKGMDLTEDEAKVYNNSQDGISPKGPLQQKLLKSAIRKLKSQNKYNKIQPSRATKDVTQEQRANKINNSRPSEDSSTPDNVEEILPYSNGGFDELDL